MLWQPQHQAGWFAKARKWLKECVRKDGAKVLGRVLMERVSEASSIVKVNSDKGYYFLKANTAASDELVKTVTISKLFGDLTLDVVDVCEELGSFVTREVGLYDAKRAEEMENSEVLRGGLSILARLQKRSLDVMEFLRSGGVAVVEPEELVNALETRWLKDNNLVKSARHLMRDRIPPIVPLLKARLEKLKQYKIPLTLNNGDIAPRNVGFKKVEKDHTDGTEDSEETMVLFDWERAYISHPFFDIHQFHFYRDRSLLSDYLAQWSEYEGPERVIECYELARPLGPLLSAHFMVCCMEKGMPGDEQSMLSYFYNCLQDLLYHLK